MDQSSMTARVSAFARAYHAEHSLVKIFDDPLAGLLLTQEEKAQIAQSMASGIQFFNPGFEGSQEEALRWVVDQQLSPSPLGRAAFAEDAFQTAVRLGATQGLLLGAGYDTFVYRQPVWAKGLTLFEVDHPATAADKQARLARAGLTVPENVAYLSADFTETGWENALRTHPRFRNDRITFCTLLGVTYYLPRAAFQRLAEALGNLTPQGSALVFDYPDQDAYTEKAGPRAKKQALLAGGAREAMLASYSLAEMEQLLETAGFLIYEHLTPEEITRRFFEAHNRADPSHAMTAFDQVNYCLAVRR